MTIAKRWAGNAFGTNTGNVYLTLDGPDEDINGKLRLNDSSVGLTIYEVKGAFDGSKLSLAGDPAPGQDDLELGKLTVTGQLTSRGSLEGDWETELGTAGTFILFPHNTATAGQAELAEASQLHTARWDLGAIVVDRNDIIGVAEELQREFKNGRVVITFVSGTERSLYLENFKNLKVPSGRAQSLKIFVQEREDGGLNRVVTVDFGQAYNAIITQSSDESWALGKRETMKRELHRFERTYATGIRKFGFGINELLLLWMIIYIPSLATLRDRIVFVAAIWVLTRAVNWLHQRYLPFAAIYLSERPPSIWVRIGPAAGSWLLAASAAVVAALISGYLQGWLPHDWLRSP